MKAGGEAGMLAIGNMRETAKLKSRSWGKPTVAVGSGIRITRGAIRRRRHLGDLLE